MLKRIVTRNRKTTLPQITSEMNNHLLNPVSIKTIQRELHTANIHDRVAIRKPLVSGRNAAKRLQWCRDHLNWTQLQWEQVIWSDESSFTLLQTTRRVFVWRILTEEFHVDCLVPTVKLGGGSVMVWAAISSRRSGPLVVFRKRITGDHYRSILADHLHPMLQTLFPGERPLFQDDNAPVHTSRCVQTWLHEHDYEVEHLA
ncbi:transposable element Tcb1 transposase [Trichonephila clavipes]|nr:transposable element Tcb1 transposase [Trichonephila clavipes]